MRKKKRALRKTPKGSPFTATIYAHVRPSNKAWLKREGRKHGSESALVDLLISDARGILPKKGFWLPKG